MIKAICLKNFQAHKDTRIDFISGVNVLAGASSTGKTSILRAINWVATNRPQGFLDIANYEIINEKKELAGEVSVTIETDSGSVSRIRNSKKNGYEVNGKFYSALKGGVPQEVLDILCFSETSLQQQFDKPFLIGESSKEVARFLNRMVNIDKIDSILSEVENERRKTNQEIKRQEEQFVLLKKKRSQYDWKDDASKMIQDYNKLDSRLIVFVEKYDAVKRSIESYDGWYSSYFTLTKLCNICEVLSENYDNAVKELEQVGLELSLFQTNISRYKEMWEAYSSLSNVCKKGVSIVSSYEAVSKELNTVSTELRVLREGYTAYGDAGVIKKEDLKHLIILLNVCEKIDSEYKEAFTKLQSMEEDVKNYASYSELYNEWVKEEKELKKQIPEVCPLCGGSMK